MKKKKSHLAKKLMKHRSFLYLLFSKIFSFLKFLSTLPKPYYDRTYYARTSRYLLNKYGLCHKERAGFIRCWPERNAHCIFCAWKLKEMENQIHIHLQTAISKPANQKQNLRFCMMLRNFLSSSFKYKSSHFSLLSFFFAYLVWNYLVSFLESLFKTSTLQLPTIPFLQN